MRHAVVLALMGLGVASPALAEEAVSSLDLTATPWGWLALLVFVIGYVFVVLEEKTHLKKSIPMIIVAGVV